MIKFLKLNLGLIKFLNVELRKKKTKKEYIALFKSIGVQYFKINLQNYKDLFKFVDPEYRKQKAQYEKYNELKKDLNKALKLLQYLDTKMEKTGLNRQRRRQFWRDFYKDGQLRKEVFEDLMKEIK